MGKKYQSNSKNNWGFSYNFAVNQPIDTRSVVDTFDDLTNKDTWKVGAEYMCYTGMPVVCADTGKIYVYKGVSGSIEDIKKKDSWVSQGGATVIPQESTYLIDSFTISDIDEQIVDEGTLETSFNLLKEAIKNNKIILIKKDYMNSVILCNCYEVETDEEPYYIIETLCNNYLYKIKILDDTIYTSDIEIIEIGSNNGGVDTYVLEHSIDELKSLASDKIESLDFNISNLIQAVKDNKVVLINYYKTHGEAAIPCACYSEDTDAEFRIEILLEKKIIIISIDLTDLEEDIVTIYTKDITITELQEKLKSGTNIKTVNGESILGEGNIKISTSTILDFTVEDVYHAHQEDTDLLGIETKSIVTDIDNKEQIYIHYDALKQGIIPCGTYHGDKDYYYILFIADNNVFKLHIVDGDTTIYIDSIINLEDVKVEITVDDQLSEGSTNPVQNKVITEELGKKANAEDIPTKVSDLKNDSSFVTSSTLEEGYQPKGDYLTKIPDNYITQEILGEKNYATKEDLEGIEVDIEVDTELSDTSENPVQNKVITEKLNEKANTDAIPTRLLQLTNDANYATTTYVDGKIPTKTSELTNNSGFITSEEAQRDYQPKGSYLTEIPSEYITNEELGGKNYATKDELTEAISNAITESINNVLNAEY